jgi:cytochrome c oxidase cbb3-type subunit 3
LFWITIGFSGLYWVYFHHAEGRGEIDGYNADMIAWYEQQAEELTALGTIDESKLQEIMHNPSMVAGGQQLFAQKCSPCHGMRGEGSIGPNLTDDYWLHGGQLADIYTTVRDGVPAKGMLPWKTQLRPAELLSVSAFVGTLRGTSPPGAKAAQGEHAPYDPDTPSPAPAGATPG